MQMLSYTSLVIIIEVDVQLRITSSLVVSGPGPPRRTVYAAVMLFGGGSFVSPSAVCNDAKEHSG